MYFDNAVAAYMNHLRELQNPVGDKYTSERFLDIMRYCCRKHADQAGVSYLTAISDATERASAKYSARFQ
jgi:hypothetical protein